MKAQLVKTTVKKHSPKTSQNTTFKGKLRDNTKKLGILLEPQVLKRLGLDDPGPSSLVKNVIATSAKRKQVKEAIRKKDLITSTPHYTKIKAGTFFNNTGSSLLSPINLQSSRTSTEQNNDGKKDNPKFGNDRERDLSDSGSEIFSDKQKVSNKRSSSIIFVGTSIPTSFDTDDNNSINEPKRKSRRDSERNVYRKKSTPSKVSKLENTGEPPPEPQVPKKSKIPLRTLSQEKDIPNDTVSLREPQKRHLRSKSTVERRESSSEQDQRKNGRQRLRTADKERRSVTSSPVRKTHDAPRTPQKTYNTSFSKNSPKNNTSISKSENLIVNLVENGRIKSGGSRDRNRATNNRKLTQRRLDCCSPPHETSLVSEKTPRNEKTIPKDTNKLNLNNNKSDSLQSNPKLVITLVPIDSPKRDKTAFVNMTPRRGKNVSFRDKTCDVSGTRGHEVHNKPHFVKSIGLSPIIVSGNNSLRNANHDATQSPNNKNTMSPKRSERIQNINGLLADDQGFSSKIIEEIRLKKAVIEQMYESDEDISSREVETNKAVNNTNINTSISSRFEKSASTQSSINHSQNITDNNAMSDSVRKSTSLLNLISEIKSRTEDMATRKKNCQLGNKLLVSNESRRPRSATTASSETMPRTITLGDLVPNLEMEERKNKWESLFKRLETYDGKPGVHEVNLQESDTSSKGEPSKNRRFNKSVRSQDSRSSLNTSARCRPLVNYISPAERRRSSIVRCSPTKKRATLHNLIENITERALPMVSKKTHQTINKEIQTSARLSRSAVSSKTPVFRRSAIRKGAKYRSSMTATGYDASSCNDSERPNIFDSLEQGNELDVLGFSDMNEPDLTYVEKPWRFEDDSASKENANNVTLNFIRREAEMRYTLSNPHKTLPNSRQNDIRRSYIDSSSDESDTSPNSKTTNENVDLTVKRQARTRVKQYYKKSKGRSDEQVSAPATEDQSVTVKTPQTRRTREISESSQSTRNSSITSTDVFKRPINPQVIQINNDHEKAESILIGSNNLDESRRTIPTSSTKPKSNSKDRKESENSNKSKKINKSNKRANSRKSTKENTALEFDSVLSNDQLALSQSLREIIDNVSKGTRASVNRNSHSKDRVSPNRRSTKSRTSAKQCDNRNLNENTIEVCSPTREIIDNVSKGTRASVNRNTHSKDRVSPNRRSTKSRMSAKQCDNRNLNENNIEVCSPTTGAQAGNNEEDHSSPSFASSNLNDLNEDNIQEIDTVPPATSQVKSNSIPLPNTRKTRSISKKKALEESHVSDTSILNKEPNQSLLGTSHNISTKGRESSSKSHVNKEPDEDQDVAPVVNASANSKKKKTSHKQQQKKKKETNKQQSNIDQSIASIVMDNDESSAVQNNNKRSVKRTLGQTSKYQLGNVVESNILQDNDGRRPQRSRKPVKYHLDIDLKEYGFVPIPAKRTKKTVTNKRKKSPTVKEKSKGKKKLNDVVENNVEDSLGERDDLPMERNENLEVSTSNKNCLPEVEKNNTEQIDQDNSVHLNLPPVVEPRFTETEIMPPPRINSNEFLRIRTDLTADSGFENSNPIGKHKNNRTNSTSTRARKKRRSNTSSIAATNLELVSESTIQPGPSHEVDRFSEQNVPGDITDPWSGGILDRASNFSSALRLGPSVADSELNNCSDFDEIRSRQLVEDDCVRCAIDGDVYNLRYINRIPSAGEFRKLGNLYACETVKDPHDRFSAGFLRLEPSDQKRPTIGPKYSFIYVVISGVAQIQLDDKRGIANTGDFFCIPIGMKYAIKNANSHKELLLSYTRIKGDAK